MGATAVGKTAAAVALVKQLPLEIISVDSTLVYRGMDIGSAKPDAATLAQAPHHLLDICELHEVYSAARFREDALRHIEDIHRRQRIPLLVGGGMLYFRALEAGLSGLPVADAGVRARLEAEAEQHGWQQLHERLQRIDPQAAARIHPNDPQRIQRALEVYELTGRPISSLQTQQAAQGLNYPLLKLVLTLDDRAELHRRIEQRFDQMLAQGLLDEVRALYERPHADPALPALRAVGYRQVWEHLQGHYDWDEMRRRGIVATRRYAKRQLTWLRSQRDCQRFDASRHDAVKDMASVISGFLEKLGY